MPPAKLSLGSELSYSSFWPGQKLGATVNLEVPQVECSQPDTTPQPVRLKSLVVQCVGFERRDPLWIRASPATHHTREDAPDASKGLSKGERVVFKSASANLLTACSLPPGVRRWFEVQVALPAKLHPSHRGTAVRWRYALVITATIDNGSVDGSQAQTNHKSVPEEIQLRKTFRVWPINLNVGGVHTSPQVALNYADLEFDAHLRWREVVPTPVTLPDAPLVGNAPAWTLGILSSSAAASSTVTPVDRAGAPDGWDHAGSGGTFLTADEVHGDRLGLGLPLKVAPLDKEDREPSGDTSRANSFASGLWKEGQARSNGHAAEISSTTGIDTRSETVPASSDSSERQTVDLAHPPLPEALPDALPLGGFTTGRTYNISIGDDPLVRFTPKDASADYSLGGIITGTLTFHHSVDGIQAWQCAQVLVTLETEQVIPSDQVAMSSSASATGDGIIRKVYDEFHEVTFNSLETHFLFSIPPDAEVSFATPMMQLRWLLRFEFVSLRVSEGSKAHGPPTAPADVNRVAWVMPFVVRPSKAVRQRAPEKATSHIALEPLPPPPQS